MIIKEKIQRDHVERASTSFRRKLANGLLNEYPKARDVWIVERGPAERGADIMRDATRKKAVVYLMYYERGGYGNKAEVRVPESLKGGEE